MMGIARTFKLKGWVIACILTLVFLFFVSRNSFIAPKQTNVVLTTSAIAAVGEAYNRLSASHQQLLNSALAHIRLGYVANRTPDVSTPPLLVLYSAHQQQQEQKSLDERLVDITSSYYFSMLQPGSAFAYDMTWPVKMEWYFEPAPIYMAMNTHQAQFYKNEAQPHQIEFHPHQFTEDELLETPFMEHFAERGIKIISTTDSSGSSSTPMWMTLRENPSMQGARDKYRLNHLTQKSDWFWLTSRLLFSKPSGGWFAQQLEPYRDLMGGRLDYSESYSPLDPHARKVTPEFIATKQQWLRVGLRLGDVDTTAKEIHALTAHIARLCQPPQQSIHCHVFISAPNRNLLQAARSSMTKHKMAVHAIAEGYPFADLNDDDGSEKVDETTLKKKYARTFMDWMILSRMDYLVGQQNDGFLKTAAWAAQVQTDVSIENSRIIPMSDW